jgi:hypothetical protein
MKILNPLVQRDIDAGRGLRLNLGCGRRSRSGFYGVDRVALPGVDILADLDEPLSALPDDSVEEVYCRHTLEHVVRFLELIAELHRVTRPEGRIEVIVPHFSTPTATPTRRTCGFFGAYSFTTSATRPINRRAVCRRSTFRSDLRSRSGLHAAARFCARSRGSRLSCNRWSTTASDGWTGTERRLCRWLPADSIRYVLRPKSNADDRRLTPPQWTASTRRQFDHGDMDPCSVE